MILAVGTTPTVQRTMRFARFAVGEVNRAREVLITASGKAVNVARVVTLLGGESRLLQFLGGETGRYIDRVLTESGIGHDTTWVEGDAATRTCTTLIPDDGPVTELVEEAQPVTAADVERLCETVERHIGQAKALCLSGSFPAGVPDDFYARLVRAARDASIPTLVDAQKAPLRAALAERPFLVKPNREESAATLGLTLSGDAEADALTAVAALNEAGAQWALVSMGSVGSLLGHNSGERWRIVPPRVDADNPIGSGDSLAAGTLYATVRGSAVPEAVAFGTACAAANCLTPTSGVVRRADVDRLLPQVTLVRL